MRNSAAANPVHYGHTLAYTKSTALCIATLLLQILFIFLKYIVSISKTLPFLILSRSPHPCVVPSFLAAVLGKPRCVAARNAWVSFYLVNNYIISFPHLPPPRPSCCTPVKITTATAISCVHFSFYSHNHTAVRSFTSLLARVDPP